MTFILLQFTIWLAETVQWARPYPDVSAKLREGPSVASLPPSPGQGPDQAPPNTEAASGQWWQSRGQAMSKHATGQQWQSDQKS